MAMSKGVKVFLIVSAVVALLFIILVAGAGLVIYKNRDSITQGMQELKDDAERFAEGKQQSACVEEGLRRLDACGKVLDLKCEVSTQVFTDICLREAEPTPGICDGVPDEFDVFDSAKWRIARCEDVGRSGAKCQNFFGGLQRHCAKQ